MARYEIHPKTGCWVWLGGVNDRGYGLVKIGGKHRKAHVVMWEMRNGPITPGCELHHDCENKRCVNPDHLKMLTKAQHRAIHSHSSQKDVCGRGHPMTPENVYIRANGARVCRKCNAIRVGNWHKKNRPPAGVTGLMEPDIDGGQGIDVISKKDGRPAAETNFIGTDSGIEVAWE